MKNNNDDLNKIKDDLNKNNLKKMEDDLKKKWKTTSTIFFLN